MIQRMDDDALRQRKEYDQVVSERDMLGTQLIRRNDELALLYDKTKIQQSTLLERAFHTRRGVQRLALSRAARLARARLITSQEARAFRDLERSASPESVSAR